MSTTIYKLISDKIKYYVLSLGYIVSISNLRISDIQYEYVFAYDYACVKFKVMYENNKYIAYLNKDKYYLLDDKIFESFCGDLLMICEKKISDYNKLSRYFYLSNLSYLDSIWISDKVSYIYEVKIEEDRIVIKNLVTKREKIFDNIDDVISNTEMSKVQKSWISPITDIVDNMKNLFIGNII